jgi:hypothetical protein
MRTTIVKCLGVASMVYAFTWATVAFTGWGPAALHNDGPLRTAAVIVFYLACLIMLFEVPLYRRARRLDGLPPTDGTPTASPGH